jgi:DNA-binding NtrC family response regulator
MLKLSNNLLKLAVKKILLVHEDAYVASLLQSVLQDPAHTFFLANTFAEVEAQLQEHQFQLVLTDINIDGIFRNRYVEFLNESLPDATIIILTDMDQSPVAKELMSIGVEGFIDFPVSMKELKQTLQPHLSLG